VTHLPALRAAGFDVLALVGRDPKKTAERAEQFGVPLAVMSLDQAIDLPQVDAVTIATPPHTHAKLALAAIGAGKHVLCEKPFARNASEAGEVLAAATSAGIVHLLGTEFRYDAGQATLARLVGSGAVGEPRLATVILHAPVLADAAGQVPQWWGDAGQGGGWLGAHGSQVIDQIRATLGEFHSVSASLIRVADREWGAEDSFVVHFRMRSGVVGVMQSTAADWGRMLVETRITGSTGTAWIDGLSSTVWLADGSGTRQATVASDLVDEPARPAPLPAGFSQTAYEHMIAHGLDFPAYARLAGVFRDLILGRPAPDDLRPATFADGVAGMLVLDAIRESASTGGRVEVRQI
jgi:predicted dehydrogenase